MFGNWRKFKTLKEAQKHRVKLQKAGYFISRIEKIDNYYQFSIVNKKGKNPFYIRGL